MNIPESILSNLTDEQKKKMEAAQSPEEISTLAKQFGAELSLEQLEGVYRRGSFCGLPLRYQCYTETYGLE